MSLKEAYKRCDTTCKVVATATVGEAIALVYSGVHWDITSAVLIVSGWVKDRAVRHLHKRRERNRARTAV